MKQNWQINGLRSSFDEEELTLKYSVAKPTSQFADEKLAVKWSAPKRISQIL
jgi:hypothetical protein